MDLISIIICVRNSQQWLPECLHSITEQTFVGPMELSIFDDGSSDQSVAIINNWYQKQCQNKFKLILSSNVEKDMPRGVGFAKNRAVEQSTGGYLCFFDSDDIMHSDRILKQYELCRENSDSIVGCKICRIPEDSTPRYVSWANGLSIDQLTKQIYTCFGPTILMPTWFCTRTIFDKVGGFDQSSSVGVPEDLIFFFRHISLGGSVLRVDEVLLTYRYHPAATTFSVKDETIWKVRLKHLQQDVLSKWNQFTIWNAGKEGRRFYRSLSDGDRCKVIAFCDVDLKKINKKHYTYEECETNPKPKIPIIHYTELVPPVVICMKLGLYQGQFEQNLSSLNLCEGVDFVHFG